MIGELNPLEKSVLTIIDDTQFEDTFREGKKVLLFYANWCNPCKTARLMIGTNSRIAEYLKENDISQYIMDVDENIKTPGKYGVRGIPTFIAFNDGKCFNQHIGLFSPKRNDNSADMYIKFLADTYAKIRQG